MSAGRVLARYRVYTSAAGVFRAARDLRRGRP